MYGIITNTRLNSDVKIKKAMSSGKLSLILPLYPKLILKVSVKQNKQVNTNDKIINNSISKSMILKTPVGISMQQYRIS